MFIPDIRFGHGVYNTLSVQKLYLIDSAETRLIPLGGFGSLPEHTASLGTTPVFFQGEINFMIPGITSGPYHHQSFQIPTPIPH